MKYNVTADNNIPSRRVSLNYDCEHAETAFDIADALSVGFREIHILNGETGEVLFHHYVDRDFDARDCECHEIEAMANANLLQVVERAS